MTCNPSFGSLVCDTPGCAKHTVGWVEWGDPDNRNLLVCAHGLSRNARDFDFLARRLANGYRIICPDYPGRGISDPLPDPSCYTNEQYVKDTLQILASLDYDNLDWVGTSMGGLIGMGLANLPQVQIRRMVINDVGPFIPAEALELIKTYLREHPKFVDALAAERYFREVYAGFGKLTDAHYRHLVEHGVKRSEDGALVPAYDPAIIDTFVATASADIDIWPLWESITIPVLIVRGQKSGLLLAETVERMKATNSRAESVEFAGCAHAPSLMVEEQVDTVAAWLLRSS